MKPFKKIFQKLKEFRNAEYHKRMLNFILFNSVGMMWCSYILAWYGRTEIAESLSETIASVIVGVTIPYFVTKVVENVNKYGSRLNHTTKEQEGGILDNEFENNI